MKKVIVYDTTLRDGAQGEGISFSLPAKIRIARCLDEFGVDYIEGGFAASNPKDMAFFDEMKKTKLKRAKLAAFGSTRRASLAAAKDPGLAAILQAGTPEQPYYTNSSQLPVGFTDDPFEALSRQEALQSRYTGGTVLHLYMGERLSSGEACRELVRRALTRFRLPYITVTPTFSICPTHGYLAGEHPFCPRCDEERLAAKRAQLAA